MMNDNDALFMSIEKSRLPLMELVTEALDNVSMRQEGGPRLITFWGNKGIGKTTLLKNIARVLQSRPRVLVIEVEDITQLPMGEIEALLRGKLSTLSSGTTMALFLDNLDDLLRKDKDSQAFFDFELNTILPLIERGDVLMIASSQIELNQWREDDVRVRQVNRAISALTFDEIASLTNQIGIEPKKAYESTFGQPKAVNWLIKQPTITGDEIANKAWDYLLEDIPQKALEIAKVMCLLPVFNIYLLRIITEGDQQRADAQYLDYLEQVKEFIRRGMVYWDVSIGSYRFTDSAVRRLLARYVLDSQRKRYLEVQQTAAKYFRNEARSPGYLHMHLVSAVYHQAQSMIGQPSQEIGKTILMWVQGNVHAWLSARWNDVQAAWQGGAGEKAVSEEIDYLIGHEYFDAITQEIDRARKMMEMTK